MIYIPLILFFISLFCISLMIGKKLVVIRNGQNIKIEHSHSFELDLKKIKHIFFLNVKKIGYTTIFLTLKLFIKSSNFIKINSKILFQKIKEQIKKNTKNFIEEETQKREVSKYLRIISEYREKIKKMKNQIEKEEGIE